MFVIEAMELKLVQTINISIFYHPTESSHLSRTVSMRENFKGCIRNVKINSGYNGMEIVDWTDMAKLHNVLVNECPLGTR